MPVPFQGTIHTHSHFHTHLGQFSTVHLAVCFWEAGVAGGKMLNKILQYGQKYEDTWPWPPGHWLWRWSLIFLEIITTRYYVVAVGSSRKPDSWCTFQFKGVQWGWGQVSGLLEVQPWQSMWPFLYEQALSCWNGFKLGSLVPVKTNLINTSY